MPVAVPVAAIGIAFVTQAPWSLALVSFAGLPIAAGIAILRYRCTTSTSSNTHPMASRRTAGAIR